MPTSDENILNGVDPNEDAMIEEALRQDVSQINAARVARQAAQPKMEVIPPAKNTTYLVHIPGNNPNGITVTEVEKRADGTVVKLKPPRPPSASELALIKAGKHEVLSGAEDSQVPAQTDKAKRPWWHWALGGLAVTGAAAGTVFVVRRMIADGDDVDEGDETEE